MRLALVIVLSLPCTAALAQAPAQPLWEVGGAAFGVSQQAYPGADQNVQRALALPFVIYRGEWLRVDRGAAGVRALKRPSWELDVGFSGAFGSSSNDIEARRGMADLGTLVEFGPRLLWNLSPAGTPPEQGRWRLELPLRGVFDLGDGMAQRGASFEPELQFSRRSAGGWRYTLGAGAVFGNERLAAAFYRVAPAEATALRPAYEARSGLIASRLSLSLTRALNPDWSVFGGLRVDSVAGAANRASPLVRQTTGASLALGVSWTWMRSERAASD